MHSLTLCGFVSLCLGGDLPSVEMLARDWYSARLDERILCSQALE